MTTCNKDKYLPVQDGGAEGHALVARLLLQQHQNSNTTSWTQLSTPPHGKKDNYVSLRVFPADETCK